MTERYDYSGANKFGPDIDRDGEDDPEFDYFGRVLDWDAGHNDEDWESPNEDSSDQSNTTIPADSERG